ncbi:hypothetical protein NG895_06170 [Aeoliella sp. ICT_H6.2]|uniref:STAS domain-containing protein n=1 Tax=Aeoliella straminimaris TaxID=2954799 RepID=A0A9X2F705_9BACT|nr:hypothetical protein [Aeoliella straminimaris]MCO6043487.1 hypothetical protein [Aeoliella straminimaris]
MNGTESGFQIDVSRGPNWVFLRLSPGESGTTVNEQQLSDDLWNVVSRHLVYRVVLEFGPQFKSLTPMVIAQLDAFRTRLESHDGALRVCGLNKKSADTLASYCAESKLRSRLTSHSSVACAVFGTEDTEADHKAEEVTQDTAYEALRVH